MFRTTYQLSRCFLRLGSNTKFQILNSKPVYNLLRIQFCSNSNAKVFNITGLREDINIQTLTGGNEELEKKLKLILLEIDMMQQEGSPVPETTFLKQDHWVELLNKVSKNQRRKYLQFLFKLEKKKENRIAKKEEAKRLHESRPPYQDDGHIRYGLNHNTFYIRIYESTINQLDNSRLISAMTYGQKLVVDCGYDAHMSARECSNCAKQLMLLFADNRLHPDPFDLHFCNANFKEDTMKVLTKYIPTLHEDWFPLNVHTKSYLDLFPKEQLVYLTPHCKNELKEYDHNAIYIIGGIVDKMINEPLSLAKAKKEGLKMAKLPLDYYLEWGSGSGKSLTLNQMISILNDIKLTNDWNHALRHVPRRKLIENSFSIVNHRHGLKYDKVYNSKFKEKIVNRSKIFSKNFFANN